MKARSSFITNSSSSSFVVSSKKDQTVDEMIAEIEELLLKTELPVFKKFAKDFIEHIKREMNSSHFSYDPEEIDWFKSMLGEKYKDYFKNTFCINCESDDFDSISTYLYYKYFEPAETTFLFETENIIAFAI